MNNHSIISPYHPTVWEVRQAEKVFTEYVKEHAYETYYPKDSVLYTSPEIIIQCALSSVWTAGRAYQAERQETRAKGDYNA